MKWRVCRVQRTVSEQVAEKRGYFVMVKECIDPEKCPTSGVGRHGHAILYRGHAPGVNPWLPVFRTRRDARRFWVRYIGMKSSVYLSRFKTPCVPTMPLVLNPKLTRTWVWGYEGLMAINLIWDGTDEEKLVAIRRMLRKSRP